MLRLTQNQANLLVKNKTVAVVGNAQSLFDYEYGRLIDSHDIVIRFNRGGPRSNNHWKHLGRRTSILAGFKFDFRRWNHMGRPPIFYRGPWSRDVANHRKWQGMQEWRAEQGREDCISEYTDKGPSNGVMLLEVLVNLFEPKAVRIFGFDFFATKSWYPESKGKVGENCHHDGFGEEWYIINILKFRSSGFKDEYKGVFEWNANS